MDFKPSIKTLGWLLVLLAMLGVGVVSSAGAMNYGGVFLFAGIANLFCWAFAIWKLVKKLINDGTI